MESVIVWFRQDLRLNDNPALHAALKTNSQIIPLYCFTVDESGSWESGAASRWWLHHSLISLANDIKALGSQLIIRKGSSLNILQQLAKQTNATKIYCNELYEPDHIKRDGVLKEALNKLGIEIHCFHGNILVPPSHVKNKSGSPYRVFTPFYRYYLTNGFNSQCIARPGKLNKIPDKIKSLTIDSLKLLPEIRWHADFENSWTPGETGAQAHLNRFCKNHLPDYPRARDIPSIAGTTNLSPHLHFGEISPRQVVAELNRTSHATSKAGLTKARDEVIRELIWRDFACYILVHYPHTSDQVFSENFQRFPWKRSDKKFLEAWQKGRTGIPIVDAGMRQLWKTGWMHNRVRMIVASLLTKNANLHWLNGARWFWDTLVDADLANNSMNWQWVAGCGVDAAPYFRIFNPVTQGKKFDPDGDYVSQWVPELSRFPARYIHDPWNAPERLQKEINIIIGRHYPKPVLDLSQTRKEILTAYKQFRQNNRKLLQ